MISARIFICMWWRPYIHSHRVPPAVLNIPKISLCSSHHTSMRRNLFWISAFIAMGCWAFITRITRWRLDSPFEMEICLKTCGIFLFLPFRSHSYLHIDLISTWLASSSSSPSSHSPSPRESFSPTTIAGPKSTSALSSTTWPTTDTTQVILSAPALDESGRVVFKHLYSQYCLFCIALSILIFPRNTGVSRQNAKLPPWYGCQFASCMPESGERGWNYSDKHLHYINGYPNAAIRHSIHNIAPRL